MDADSGHKTEYHKDTSEPPGGFLKEIGGLAHTHHLGGSREIGGESTTLGVLHEHNQCEQNTDNDNQDYDDVIQHSF